MRGLTERLQIGKRGTVTLPASLRKRYGLDAAIS
ncbi:hypothetical protein HRbin33_01935 [bacterium HR33]|nr:hypothetical protein HRbin33_01935 [bacterium HR33]